MYLITRINNLYNSYLNNGEHDFKMCKSVFQNRFMNFYDSLVGIEQQEYKTFANKFEKYLMNNHNLEINIGGIK